MDAVRPPLALRVDIVMVGIGCDAEGWNSIEIGEEEEVSRDAAKNREAKASVAVRVFKSDETVALVFVVSSIG